MRTVCNHANRPTKKRTLVIASRGLFLTCRGEKYTVLVHHYTIYTVTKCVPSNYKNCYLEWCSCVHGCEPPSTSSPMLQDNYPFFQPLAPTHPSLALINPFDPRSSDTHVTQFYELKATSTQWNSSQPDTETTLNIMTYPVVLAVKSENQNTS